MLLLISMASAFLIFLDYHSSKNIHWSIIYVAIFFGMIILFSTALDVFKFNLLFLVMIIPSVLFGVLYLKNRNNNTEDIDF